MHLIFDDIAEAHLCQTLHDNGIVAEVGHLKDSLASGQASSLCALEIHWIELGLGLWVPLAVTYDDIRAI